MKRRNGEGEKRRMGESEIGEEEVNILSKYIVIS